MLPAPMRTVYLYHPPVETPVPLLFVYDGYDYLHRARLNVIVDNLIARKAHPAVRHGIGSERRLSPHG